MFTLTTDHVLFLVFDTDQMKSHTNQDLTIAGPILTIVWRLLLASKGDVVQRAVVCYPTRQCSQTEANKHPRHLPVLRDATPPNMTTHHQTTTFYTPIYHPKACCKRHQFNVQSIPTTESRDLLQIPVCCRCPVYVV